MTLRLMHPALSAMWGRILCAGMVLILAACATAHADKPPPESLELSLAPALNSEAKMLGSKTAQAAKKVTTGIPSEAKQAAPEPARPSTENNIFFARMATEISEEAQEPIHRYAEMLKTDPHLNVLLVGHTEALGSQEYCIALASKRTHAVAMELVRLGVRPLQVREHPQGCDTSATACRTEDCNDLKRRVEFQIQK